MTPIQEAVRALARGGVVAFPTETVWGLGAGLDRPDGIERLFEIKGRARDKPLQVMVASIDALPLVARPTDEALGAASRLMPGPVSVVLPAAPDLPDLGGRSGTVAVRVPDHPVAAGLLAAYGPLATTSANRSGQPTPSDLTRVRGVFGDAVDVYLDGPAPAGTPSTLVDLTGPEPVVLRAGAVATGTVTGLLRASDRLSPSPDPKDR